MYFRTMPLLLPMLQNEHIGVHRFVVGVHVKDLMVHTSERGYGCYSRRGARTLECTG